MVEELDAIPPARASVPRLLSRETKSGRKWQKGTVAGRGRAVPGVARNRLIPCLSSRGVAQPG
ncbi:MAG: hypothetical protein QOK08_1591 [Actinomycetota bacterium]|jgi:hypothetical protein|nr:hypothetical protein [Actinomycetota bacterium]